MTMTVVALVKGAKKQPPSRFNTLDRYYHNNTNIYRFCFEPGHEQDSIWLNVQCFISPETGLGDVNWLIQYVDRSGNKATRRRLRGKSKNLSVARAVALASTLADRMQEQYVYRKTPRELYQYILKRCPVAEPYD